MKGNSLSFFVSTLIQAEFWLYAEVKECLHYYYAWHLREVNGQHHALVSLHLGKYGSETYCIGLKAMERRKISCPTRESNTNALLVHIAAHRFTY